MRPRKPSFDDLPEFGTFQQPPQPGHYYVYVVRTGAMCRDQVQYENVAAFSDRRDAERVVRKAKSEDAYTAQYDDVERLKLDDPDLIRHSRQRMRKPKRSVDSKERG